MHTPLTPAQIIDALGGTSETARLCDVSDPAVSQWRKAGIPKAQLKFLKLARPDVFVDLAPEPVDPAEDRPRRLPPSATNIMAMGINPPAMPSSCTPLITGDK